MSYIIKTLTTSGTMPERATEGSVGYDLVATSIQVLMEKPMFKLIEYGTGLFIEGVKEVTRLKSSNLFKRETPTSYFVSIIPRSSLSKKDLLLPNSIGIIDQDYRGELKVRFLAYGDDIYQIGDKIAQLVILNYAEVKFVQVDTLDETSRGTGGFGSTGN